MAYQPLSIVVVMIPIDHDLLQYIPWTFNCSLNRLPSVSSRQVRAVASVVVYAAVTSIEYLVLQALVTVVSSSVKHVVDRWTKSVVNVEVNVEVDRASWGVGSLAVVGSGPVVPLIPGDVMFVNGVKVPT